MAPVTLEKVKKVYPNGFEALHGLDLHVDEGEFMVLVGPSGCGKTTALRMVAGLEDITNGTLRIGDKIINHVSPKDRDIAMVFQNYALYPHMNVAENIGFALKLRKVPKDVIRRRVAAAADVLGLTEWLDRKPAQLSGGQRQRVAMGRAIVREPSVFLMDEPLSNLDAKLRVQMRAEVLRIQRRLGVATLYVTHDQTEAMTMGDRVAVLNGGSLQQCDKPQVLYDRPDNLFAATFIGSPAMNLFEGGIGADGETLHIGSQQISLPDSVHVKHPSLRAYSNRSVAVGIRPEGMAPAAGPGSAVLAGRVELVEALGSEILVHFQIDAKKIVAEDANLNDEEHVSGGQIEVQGEAVARVDPRTDVKVGEKIFVGLDTDRLHFFDLADGKAIRE